MTAAVVAGLAAAATGHGGVARAAARATKRDAIARITFRRRTAHTAQSGRGSAPAQQRNTRYGRFHPLRRHSSCARRGAERAEWRATGHGWRARACAPARVPSSPLTLKDALVRAAFGGSPSDSGSDTDSAGGPDAGSASERGTWLPRARCEAATLAHWPRGLVLCRQFLPREALGEVREAVLRAGIACEAGSDASGGNGGGDHGGDGIAAAPDQVMYFGELPDWIQRCADAVDAFAGACAKPPLWRARGHAPAFAGECAHLAADASALCRACAQATDAGCEAFAEARRSAGGQLNQAILNAYSRRGSLPAHVDLPRFADGIAALSLWGDCTMRFAPAVGAPCERAGAARGGAAGAVTLALSGGDLLLMSHEARWSWTHEVVDVSSERRVSLTLRHLPPDG